MTFDAASWGQLHLSSDFRVQGTSLVLHLADIEFDLHIDPFA